MAQSLLCAFQTNPMERHQGFVSTIITEDPCFSVLKLRGHRLSFDVIIILPERQVHIDHTFTADRTFVGVLHVLGPACVMYTMAALHENDRFWGRKHILSTDWTIAIGRALYTFVIIQQFDCNACRAFLGISVSLPDL